MAGGAGDGPLGTLGEEVFFVADIDGLNDLGSGREPIAASGDQGSSDEPTGRDSHPLPFPLIRAGRSCPAGAGSVQRRTFPILKATLVWDRSKLDTNRKEISMDISY
jgi:hypothetical protein